MPFKKIKDFFLLESASSIVLAVMTALAMLAANLPWAEPHYLKLRTPEVTHWVNDGLMALFFLVIGIEIKKEITVGHLSGKGQALLPAVAACGGVILPAIIYALFNHGTPAMAGWAIPTATDIAFSLGVLALFPGINPGLRVFLLAVAVIDDLIAVLIIALFYSQGFEWKALVMAAICIALIFAYQKKQQKHLLPFLFAGAALWASLLESGIHATIAGVVLGVMMPLGHGERVLKFLHPWVAFAIIPFFAFINAGISLQGLNFSELSNPVPAGILWGLFAGKQAGIFLASWLLIRFRFAPMPQGARWRELYGVCMVAGIGFTMSLFIGALAFTDATLLRDIRLGVIVGSLASAVGGITVLALTTRHRAKGV